MTPEVAVLEHEELSPSFLRWLREANDLSHDVCSICHPPVLDGGLDPNPDRRRYTKVITCPLCGVLIREAAIVLAEREYARHLTIEHDA